jgi:TorA maturation chaperone TorD
LRTVDPDQLRVAAALLSMPTDDSVDAVRDMLPTAPWLRSSLPELERLPSDRWQAEHTRLFITGYPRTPCPPFESAYRHGTMGGTAAGDLEALYRRAGLRSGEVPADYLGTMLECAAYLQEQGMEELLEELFEQHLGRWVPRFARDLRDSAELELYRELGAQLGRLCPPRDHG